jgi:hypothetical protein
MTIVECILKFVAYNSRVHENARNTLKLRAKFETLQNIIDTHYRKVINLTEK